MAAKKRGSTRFEQQGFGLAVGLGARIVAVASPDDYDRFNPTFIGRYLVENTDWHFINAFGLSLKSGGVELVTYAFSSSGRPGLYRLGRGGGLVRLIRPSRLALKLLGIGGIWRYVGSLINTLRLVRPLLEDNPKVVLNTHFPHFPRGEALSVLAKIMGKRFGYFQSITLPGRSMYDFVAKMFQHITDFYIFTDEDSRREAVLRYAIPLEKTHVVGLRPHVDPATTVGRTWRRPKAILYVGRLEDGQKAVSTLIRAFGIVARRYPEAELRIVGEGFDRPALEALASQLGLADKTRFLGWLSGQRLEEEYRSAYAFCLPSRRESYALVVTEAMLAGLPVVCTDLAALRDRVENGVTALTFRPDNVEELAEKLLLLLENEDYAAQIALSGQKRARRVLAQSADSAAKILVELAKTR